MYYMYLLRTNVQQNIAAFVRFLFYVESMPANANPHQGRFFSEVIFGAIEICMACSFQVLQFFKHTGLSPNALKS